MRIIHECGKEKCRTDVICEVHEDDLKEDCLPKAPPATLFLEIIRRGFLFSVRIPGFDLTSISIPDYG